MDTAGERTHARTPLFRSSRMRGGAPKWLLTPPETGPASFRWFNLTASKSRLGSVSGFHPTGSFGAPGRRCRVLTSGGASTEEADDDERLVDR